MEENAAKVNVLICIQTLWSHHKSLTIGSVHSLFQDSLNLCCPLLPLGPSFSTLLLPHQVPATA